MEDTYLPANTGDVDLILGSGRSHGEGNDNPLHYSCLENPMDRGVHGVTKELNTMSDYTTTISEYGAESSRR